MGVEVEMLASAAANQVACFAFASKEQSAMNGEKKSPEHVSECATHVYCER